MKTRYLISFVVACAVILGVANFAKAQSTGPVNPPRDLGKVKFLVSDKLESYCAIDIADKLRCWGPEIPVFPATVDKVKKVTLSNGGICAIDLLDNLSCWGDAWGSPIGRIPPDLQQASQVTYDGSVACAETVPYTAGKYTFSYTWCWLPALAATSEPLLVTNRIWKSFNLAASAENICGLDFEDRLVCQNIWSSFGAYATQFINHPTVPVLDYQLSDGADGCLLDKQGFIQCFGYGIETGHAGVTPTDAATALSVGRLNACAIMAYDKKIVCWDMFTKPYYSGVSTPIWDEAKALATGFRNGCAVLLDDTVKCWSNSPLGNGG